MYTVTTDRNQNNLGEFNFQRCRHAKKNLMSDAAFRLFANKRKNHYHVYVLTKYNLCEVMPISIFSLHSVKKACKII